MADLLKRLLRWLDGASEPDVFVTLVQLAAEDSAIRTQLLSILDKPDADRRVLLQQWIERMQAEGAPEAFTDAISQLQQRAVAERLLAFLQSQADP